MGTNTVVVVGGGILGASVAYHLARKGVRGVTLLERLEIANAASSRAAGLVLQLSSKPAVDRLCRRTLAVIGELEEQLGESLNFHQNGTLRLARTDASRSALAALSRRAQQEGLSAQTVDSNWLARHLPWLDAGHGALAVFFPDDGYIDAYRLTTAYARAANRNGVRVESGVAAGAVCLEKGRVTGIETSRGKRRCEALVLAAGAWINTLTVPMGVSLPLAPTRSQFWLAAAAPLFAADQPMTVLADARAYTRPEVGGLLIGLQEERSLTFDYRRLPEDIGTFKVTENGSRWDALEEGAGRLREVFPAFDELCFTGYGDGLSTYTPDGHFVVGPIEAVSGLYVAAGCCGSGVMASGGIGEALAHLLSDGTSAYDLSPFRPERFGHVDPADPRFRERCAAARAGKAA